MAEKKQYSMLVFSNPTEGLEEEYLEWYAGQHIHDLLRIPGYVGCKFFKLADIQLSDVEQKYSYMIIWDFETDDFPSVVKDISERMKDGRTVFIPAFDTAYFDNTWTPITKYVTSKEIEGKSVEKVLEISEFKKLTTTK
ncbi:hypothetical protein [Neobacillus sp. FSL H8-0543]|uniref:hypothetical protein n=1 Tax=Neobacillus sp. FSL H8-0543 TaxID=2954672 RepID=UPI00315947CD